MEHILDFCNRHGQSIVGVLHVPLALEPSCADKVVILSHGFLADKDALFFKDLARSLRLISFRFDYPLFLKDGITLRFAAFHEEMQDLREVVVFLQNKQYKAVGFIGHSKGAVIVNKFLSSFRDEELCCHVAFAVCISGRVEMQNVYIRNKAEKFRELKEKGYYSLSVNLRGQKYDFRITQTMLNEFQQERPDLDALNIRPSVRLLIIHGTKDNIVPFSDGQMLASLMMKTARFIPIEGADHGFSKHGPILISQVSEWISNVLGCCSKKALL